MFSKFLFTLPIPNSDSLTVSQAIFQAVCTFRVCDCIISDRGSEFISQCTDYLCKMLDTKQNFTPSYRINLLAKFEMAPMECEKK
jgi:hypothetical protein